MADVNDWGDAAVATQQKPQANDWGDLPVDQPKAPDTSGIQKMAQENLSANDNKAPPQDGQIASQQTPLQRMSVAAGMPVDKVINGTAQPTDIKAQQRAMYLKAIGDGSAANSTDWMQTYIHSVGDAIVGGGERAVGTLAYPFLSQENRQKLIDSGKLGEIPTLTGNAGHDIAAESLTRANALLSPGVGVAYTTIASPLAPLLNPVIEAAPGIAQKTGISPENASLIPSAAEFGMNLLGLRGAAGFHYSEPIKEVVAKKLDIPSESVTPDHVNQVVSDGAKNLLPPPQDFKTASRATGIAEPKIKNLYQETGVSPEKFVTDIPHDPAIAAEVSAGKVPEAYEHMVEEKPTLPVNEAEKLKVITDKDTKLISVVDKDGDHIQGGFDTPEEAQYFIDDQKFKAEERAAIEEESKTPKPIEPTTEKTEQGEQQVIPGAEKISEKTLAERKMDELLKGDNAPLEGGLFDVAGRGQGDIFDQPVKANEPPAEQAPIEVAPKAKPQGIVAPSEIGKTTSLRSFLSQQSLKAKFNEGHELVSIVKNGEVVKGDVALEYAHELAKEYGYMPKDSPDRPNSYDSDLANHLKETDGGREATREQDADRVAKAREADDARKLNDPVRIEKEAHDVGIDTERAKGETQKQFIKRLKDSLTEFYKNEHGYGDTYRSILGDTIKAAERFVGKVTGNIFQKFADAYIKTLQPELMGDKALRMDAYLAKMKTKLQEAQNSFYRHSAAEIKRWDRLGEDAQKEWLYDHETGRWNEEDNLDHAKTKAVYDRMREEEKKAGVGNASYKEDYLPHQHEKPDEVAAFFRSDAMIKKYGNDWFNKASVFKLVQEADRAGFKLKTYNPERMQVARALASHNLIATMDLLKDAESSGIATRATLFSIDKKITKTQAAIDELAVKYKKEFEKKNNPNQPLLVEGTPPAESKVMKVVEKRMDALKERLEDFNKQKADNKITPEQMKDLKTGFRIIGPDNKAWNIHQEVAPLWKNAMDMKGLWEREGVLGDGFRYYSAAKNIYTDLKLSLSLFHPLHEVLINTAGVIADPVYHLIQGGKFSDLAWKDLTNAIPTGDGRGIEAWNTTPEDRTPQQHADVQRMVEGGMQPTMSYRDTIHFKENWDKAIAGVGANNLRLITSALQAPGKVFEPLFNKWIPRLRSEMYFSLTDKALLRDPALAGDAGRRSEVFRSISQDIDRSFGQLNQDTLFWNKNVKDAFNASYISGGWKLAQIFNMRGLLEPAGHIYNFAKTGEFSKADITYNMVQAYAYTGVTLAFGTAVNKMLGNPIGKTLEESKSLSNYLWNIVKDCQFIKTGEKNADGTPISVSQPSFMKEWFMAVRDINEQGLIRGAGQFVYNGTMIPAIKSIGGVVADGVSDAITRRPDPIGKDTLGRHIIENPLNYHEWMNAGWDGINPITISSYEQAEEKGSAKAEIAGLAGMPIAGKYIDQTPFEQRVMALYYEQNPSKGSVYTSDLSAKLKAATAQGKTDDINKIKGEMKQAGMSEQQISAVTKKYSEPFTQHAWKELSLQDQKRLIESASDEEKKIFKLKSQ